MDDTVGGLYIATGEKYVNEAVVSARSWRKHMRDIPISIITDEYPDSDVFNDVTIVEDPSHSFKDNLDYIDLTPYDRTIFLDSDTFICRDISDIFDLLEEFDIAAAHDTGRRRELYKDDEIEVHAPESFPMYNSGVVAYKMTEQVEKMFEKWSDIYGRHANKISGVVNQPSFREAVYKSNTRIATLPPEYNCRIPYPTYLRGDVKIIHGRTSNFAAIEKTLNAEPTDSRRTFLTFEGRTDPHIFRLNLDKWQYMQRSLFKSLFERGIYETSWGLFRWYRGGDFWES